MQKVIDLFSRTRVRRREFITLLAGAATTWPLAARAQQSTFQVGFLYPGPQAAASPRIAAYSSGLQAGGIRPQQVNIIARVTGGALDLVFDESEATPTGAKSAADGYTR